MPAKRTGAPDYDDPSFWDLKFATGQDVGEWLNPGEVLLDSLLAFLEKHTTPKVLHLGPGISKLGARVRDAFVTRDWKGNNIVNADFSSEAVRLGQDAERAQDPSHAMHWLRIDLRSWTDVTQLLPFAPFDAILDKSTSDAIATSSPVTLQSSDASAICPALRQVLTSGEEITLAPVELLALHLVPLTRKGSRWFVMSYSTMRFDNLPHILAYWEIVARHPLEAPCGQTASGAPTPPVYHWMYTLQRK
ncbi:hypothetical protein BJY04DRAFT_179073 [Aspergillus karnatakaensis]|uniref:uncharacterized protein n=1 Tax=Aspergillus karnatakaensis TaxID=1810916 RepID=UPI003CCD407E